MKPLIIYGASYFDLIKLIDAINSQQPTWQLRGFLDDTPEKQRVSYLGIPVLGGRDLLPKLVEEGCYFFNNVCGSWQRSESIAGLLCQHDCNLARLVHPSIDLNYVELGEGALLADGVIVGSQTKIGDFLTTRLGSVISHDVIIEDHVFIGPGVVIGSGVRIQKGAFIGAGATVMLERTVGTGSLVGAGAVVSKDVPDFVSVAGVPAREIGKRK
jgi:sugar O-acyltransferase (sialic acid O-acetyltransferase NeuD family)